MGEADEGLGGEDMADVECSQAEPVNFHSMSFEVYDELLHRSGAKAVVDLTCRVPREVLDGFFLCSMAQTGLFCRECV